MKYLTLRASVLLAVFVAVPALSQDQTRSVWDGVYTEEQAERGSSVYSLQCSACHGPSPAIEQFADQPLSELFSYIRTNMPDGAPGSLSGSEYADAVAYLLQSAGFPAGEEELPTVSRSMTDIMLTFTNDDTGEAAAADEGAAEDAPSADGGTAEAEPEEEASSEGLGDGYEGLLGEH